MQTARPSICTPQNPDQAIDSPKSYCAEIGKLSHNIQMQEKKKPLNDETFLQSLSSKRTPSQWSHFSSVASLCKKLQNSTCFFFLGEATSQVVLFLFTWIWWFGSRAMFDFPHSNFFLLLYLVLQVQTPDIRTTNYVLSSVSTEKSRVARCSLHICQSPAKKSIWKDEPTEKNTQTPTRSPKQIYNFNKVYRDQSESSVPSKKLVNSEHGDSEHGLASTAEPWKSCLLHIMAVRARHLHRNCTDGQCFGTPYFFHLKETALRGQFASALSVSRMMKETCKPSQKRIRS